MTIKNFKYNDSVGQTTVELPSPISGEVAESRGYDIIDKAATLRKFGFTSNQLRVPAYVCNLWNPKTEKIFGYQSFNERPRFDKETGRMVYFEIIKEDGIFLDANPVIWAELRSGRNPIFVTFSIDDQDVLLSAGQCSLSMIGLDLYNRIVDDEIILSEIAFTNLHGREIYLLSGSRVNGVDVSKEILLHLKKLFEAKGADVSIIVLPKNHSSGVRGFLLKGKSIEDLILLDIPEWLSEVSVEKVDKDNFDDVAEESGDELLKDVRDFVTRFVNLPHEEYAVAIALWILHSHSINSFDSTPRLAILSPEKQSGKTRLLEVLALLVARPLQSLNISAAALFRSIEARQPTVLIDESDTIFGSKTGDHEDLRAVLNSGHRKGAVVSRCINVDGNTDVRDFSVYGAVALAGIGNLPDTITDRSIQINMRRRAYNEPVEQFRSRDAEPEGRRLNRRIEAWSRRNEENITNHIPEMPPGISDRPADVWESLLIVADVAGGNWPKYSRNAVLKILKMQHDTSLTIGELLLTHIKEIIGDEDRIRTVDLLSGLVNLEEEPWGDLKGKAIDSRKLAAYLRPYGIKSGQHRFGSSTCKGYIRADFVDVWKRYTPEENNSAESKTQIQPIEANANLYRLLKDLRN